MKNMEYDILMKFKYDGIDYVLYTDNTYNEKEEFNIYGASLDKEGRLTEVTDVDMMDVFSIMINRYREKVMSGEVS